MTNFKITATFDILCPWCFIAHKRLELAKRLWTQANPTSNDTFMVKYRVIQLRPIGPRGPSSSISIQDFLAANFGVDHSDKVHQHITVEGKKVDIAFKFGGSIGNSWDAIRLIRLAAKHGDKAEAAVIGGLFVSHFEQEQDITQYDTLESIAIVAGISAKEFQRAIIDSSEGGPEVEETIMQCRLEGITSVPQFIIQDRHRVLGPKDPEAFLSVFNQVKVTT
ncbi:hypothetical protein ACHAP8_011591 [Fusarium lateritium]